VTFVSSRAFLGCWVAAAVGLVVSDARADDDPITVCISASDRGLDLRKQGKLIEARSLLASCAAAVCGPDISTVCQKRLADINATLPSIVFSPKDAAGNDVAGVRVTVDGTSSSQTLDGRPLVMDPGPHSFRFEAAGQPSLERSFVLVEGAKDRQERINLAPPAAVSTASPTQAAPGGDAGVNAPNHSQQSAGLWVGGLGLAAVAAGSVFGVIAKIKWSASQTDCETSANCLHHDQAVSEHSAAVTDAAISTITCVAGGAAVITGAVLLLTAPHEPSAVTTTGSGLHLTPSVGPGSVALSIGGVFR
jgi:hypothetical protein